MNNALLTYSRWNIEADDEGILVCRGEHEKHEHCEAHMERLSPQEVRAILNDMRDKLLDAHRMLTLQHAKIERLED